MHCRLQILGSPEVQAPDGSPIPLSLGKPLALLIYVVCHPEGVLRDDLASLLWPDTPREKGRHSLRQAIWILKSAFGQDLFEGDESIRLRDGVLECDLDAFKSGLARGALKEVQPLWRGSFLDGFVLSGGRHWDHWVDDVRTELERRYHQALIIASRDIRQEGRVEEALEYLEVAIEVSPGTQEAHRARVEILLDAIRLDEAREALANAQREVGDRSEMRETLEQLEVRLFRAAQNQRAQVSETEGFPLEFVGRSRELAQLRRLWEDARLARSHVTVITGPSGVGKTRLGRELVGSLLADEALSVVVVGTRAEMKLRWGAAAELVRQLLSLPGSAGISSSSDSLLRAMIPSLGRGEVNLQTVNGVSPAALLDAVTHLLEAVAFEAPLVVTLDDFQWFDQESRTLLTGVMRRVSEVGVLFLVQGRSDLTSRNWPEQEATLQQEAGASRMVLSPLMEEEVQELLGLVAEFPDSQEMGRTGALIHHVTGGNPIFIKTVLQELLDQGIITKEEDYWVFNSHELTPDFRFPESVGALLDERLDRLTDEAEQLASVLAGEGRASSPAKLRSATQIDEVVFTRAVAELLEREIVVWVNDTTLGFSHDLMRQAVLSQLPQPAGNGVGRFDWLGKHRGVLTAALVAALSLPLGILWGSGMAGEESEPPPPFGGGSLILRVSEGRFMSIPVGAGPPETWEATESMIRPPSEIGMQIPFMGPDGELIWIGVANDSLGPDMTWLHEDGTLGLLYPGPGDQVLKDFSPDGNHFVFFSEDMRAEGFAAQVLIGSLAGDSTVLLYDGLGSNAEARWSKNGDLIAFKSMGLQDTLVVLSLTGEKIGHLVLEEIQEFDWCGPSIVLTSATRNETNILRINVPEMAVDTVATLNVARNLNCSPDGTGITYVTVENGSIHTVLKDLRNGDAHPLAAMTMGNWGSRWLPDRLPPIPVEIEASDHTLQMGWGDRQSISARLRISDGSVSSEGIRWESLSPAVATVNNEGEVTGNGAGTTKLVSSWGYSLKDTVVVEIVDVENGTGGAFLREHFEPPLDTMHWIPIGDPIPEIVRLDSNWVLSLKGDGKYQDALISRNPIPIDQGVTVELEFKLTVTSNLHQALNLCLRDSNESLILRDPGTMALAGDEVCFRYPARELDRMNPSEGALWAGSGIESRVLLPDEFPTDDWTHVAIQVRADGVVSLIVNREWVLTSPVRIETESVGQWTVTLDGEAVETDLYVRHPTIWLEPRYAIPEDEVGGGG